MSLDLKITHHTTGTEKISVCDSIRWKDGKTYTSDNNSATYIRANSVGCDSLVTLDLTILHSNTGIDRVSACDSA